MSAEGNDLDLEGTLPPDAVIGGKYQVVRLLGSGGMGAVYEARNSWTGRRVAVKMLHAQFARKPDNVRRFLREAKAATAISHPNIVDVLDMGEDPAQGGLFIVQEFLEGVDLARRMQQVPALTMRESLGLLAPVMSALVAAHRQGIVHRDIKPENIFLTVGPRGVTEPKLIDFGISKVLDGPSADRSRTQTGVAIGTPQYMSPEQARGRSDVDGRSDVWSMGVLLYELIAGRLPFDAPNYNLLIVAILTTPAPRIEEVSAGVPEQLAAVIHRALEPDLAQRYGSMSDFLAAVLECPLDDGAPLVDPAQREAFLSGVVLRDSSEPPTATPSREPAAPLAPTEEDAHSAPTLTPTQWQQAAAQSWMPRLTNRRAAVAGLVVALVGSAATMGVMFGRRTAAPLVPGAPVVTAIAPAAPSLPPLPVAPTPTPVVAIVDAGPPLAPAVVRAPVRPAVRAARPAVRPAVRPTAGTVPAAAVDPLTVDTHYPGRRP